MKPMLCMILLFVVSTVAADDEQKPSLQLTSEQVVQVRALVKRTQTNQSQLKADLAQAQEKLARCYSGFALDNERIAELHGEIANLQQKLLDSHYSMQKELRKLVDADQFKALTKRIAAALGTPATPGEK